MKITRLTSQILFLAISAMLVLGFGCNTSKPTPDPLTGWTFRGFDDYEPSSERHHYQLDNAITDDYQDFIKTNNLDTMGAITGFYEDGTGQHAIEFEGMLVGPNSRGEISWHYVLIYNKDNKRVKTTKYNRTRYQS
ncbi:MAG TPA: hypothetical protein VGI03_02640 [Verrucomicrobiae bacterium]|jgi:hypothetical protein